MATEFKGILHSITPEQISKEAVNRAAADAAARGTCAGAKDVGKAALEILAQSKLTRDLAESLPRDAARYAHLWQEVVANKFPAYNKSMLEEREKIRKELESRYASRVGNALGVILENLD